MRRTALLLGCLLLLGTACVKEKEGPSAQQPGGDKLVTIRVAVPEEPFSKVSFTEQDGKLKTAWQETDCLRVISGENSAVFTISNIISPHEAEFVGPAVAGTSFDILYPGTYGSVDEARADAISPAQTGNGSTAHLGFRALLQGVDTYEEIAFRQNWAAEHGGAFKQGAALKLVVTLPGGVSTLKKAGVTLNGVNYALPLSGVDVSEAAQVLTAYLMLPWEDIPLPDGTAIPVYAMGTDNEVYSGSVSISGNKTILQGKLNSIGAHSTFALTIQDFVGGDGSVENPYLIANARQLNNMHGVMANGTSHAFRLLEDIDAESIDNWVPLNNENGFSKAMDFDGSGHTIYNLSSSGVTYASFTGVLNGTLRDVTFDGATINHSGKLGVVGGFIGTTDVVGSCTDVHVRNSSVTSSNNWAGGFAGEINTTGTLLRCSVESTTVTSPSHVGAFAGIVRGQVARLTDCYTGNFTLVQHTTPSAVIGLGGFVGCTTSNGIFEGCHVDGPFSLTSTSTLVSKDSKNPVGGFIGYIASNKPVFTDCYVAGTPDSHDAVISGNAETGGFVGYSDRSATYTRCEVRNAAVSGVYHLGGFLGYGTVSSGYEVPSIYTQCRVQDSAVTQNLASGSGSIFTGGFAGGSAQALSFVGCTVQGTAVSATKAAVQNVGGFVGCTTYAGANFQGCSVDGATSVTAKANSVGGFVGWAYVPDAYKDCSSAATVTVTGQYQKTGGFVGYASASAAFTGCVATGNVNSEYTYAGGFAGLAQNASFTRCHYDNGTLRSTVSGKGATCGGFVGYAHSGVSFDGCYVQDATVNVPSGGRTGGFAGQLGESSNGGNNITVTDCHVSGTVVDGAINTGGFVGVQYAPTSKCYVLGGTVTAHNAQVGGFSAYVQSCDITNCFTTATVAGGSYADVGGFMGLLWEASVQYCYSAGSMTGSGDNRGAFVGRCALQGNPGSVAHAIAWNASLPFCGNNAAPASLTDIYAGTESVSAKAAEQLWSTVIWDIGGPLPLLIPGQSRIPAIFVGDSITWQWARVSRTDSQSLIQTATHGVLGDKSIPPDMVLNGTNFTSYFHPGFFSGNGYIDKGISGQQTRHMRERFRKDVLALNPQVFVLMGGTNDIANAVPDDTIFENVAWMAEKADSAGIKVILCSITPNNREYAAVGWKSVHIEALNARYQALCALRGYTWCDYWSALVARSADEAAVETDIDHGLKDCYKLYDDLHPGPMAYTVMEGIIKPLIDALLNPGGGGGGGGGDDSSQAGLGNLDTNDVLDEI